ncbi:hypothetical protein CTI12_AA047180 [Artemisia annua]|uniref:Defective in meristem silencing 3 n=1 Tax=Artemisia annua TaxID=35608 RepID=A0A2U1QCI4_ARTAN|nr:hypothetical protein CTI12_AA047180 [Artemisia annua]
MFSPNQHQQQQQQPQMPIHANMLNVQVPPQVNYVGQNDASYAAMNGVPHNPLSQAESLVHSSKKLENELLVLGQNVKHHEDNLVHLTACINSLNDQINDMQVILGKNNSSSTPMPVDGEDRSHKQNQKETVEHIMQHEKSAAGVVCQLKHHHADLASSTNDVLGVVATLGKVNDDNVSRILSEYLGLDTMLALVCTTYKGVEALESYDKEGLVCKNSGLHGLAASVERTIDGRFNVFCLENLRPYVGEFIPDDPQRRLALVKPKLPNGVTPDGFLGFAVNMINVDFAHLSSLTSDGHGIRETLFYTLFSRLQVYKTRAHMLQALPFLSDGAISLDGGIIRSNGIFVIGTCRDEMDVKFGISSCLPENLVDIEKKMKELKWKRDSTLEELKQGEQTLKHVRYTFEVKRQEFFRFMAQSSPYAMQYSIPATPRRPTPR